MDYLQSFANSLSTAQLAAALGFLMWAFHTALNRLDRNNRLTVEFNKFVRNAAIVLVPLTTTLTQVINDPSLAALAHNYAPSLAYFILTYQGLYWALQSVFKKFQQVQALLAPVESESAF